MQSSARARLILFLTLALLPIGAISLGQSKTLALQSREMSQRALMAETIRVAAAQRAVIQTAEGQARALVPLVRPLTENPVACTALMVRFVEGAANVPFAGLLDPDGHLVCASHPRHGWGGAAQTPEGVALDPQLPLEDRAYIDTTPSPALAGENALLVSEPIPDNTGTPLGYLVLSLPFAALHENALPGAVSAQHSNSVAPELMTFDAAQNLLWASGGAKSAHAHVPASDHLPSNVTDIAKGGATAFYSHSQDGRERVYAVVPVVEGAIATLGTWRPESLFGDTRSPILTLGLVLPILMWGVGVIVAVFAVDRQILQPLSELRARMAAFTEGARGQPPLNLGSAPAELREVAESFTAMTDRISADETRLEQSVHEREVLLKEVHHRVKNNLQLIVSILNMQLRQTENRESRAALRRVQGRVMGLATVHQHLYQSGDLTTMGADEVLGEISARLLAQSGLPMGEVEVVTQFAPVQLYPDQVVPLSLLLGEAMNNALGHLGRPEDGRAPRLEITLSPSGEETVILTCSNTCGAPLSGQARRDISEGLGRRLIDAFAMQLDGEVAEHLENEVFQLTLTFDQRQFEADHVG